MVPGRAGRRRSVKVICFGDSNTWGYDPRSCLGGRYEPDSRWADILAAKTGWAVSNWGLNGRGIPRAAPAFPADTGALLVMLGTNDLLQGSGPAAAAERMEQFLRSVGLGRVGPEPAADRGLPDLCPMLPVPGRSPGNPVLRCRRLGRGDGVRRRPLHGPGPQGLCRRAAGGAPGVEGAASCSAEPAFHLTTTAAFGKIISSS